MARRVSARCLRDTLTHCSLMGHTLWLIVDEGP